MANKTNPGISSRTSAWARKSARNAAYRHRRRCGAVHRAVRSQVRLQFIDRVCPALGMPRAPIDDLLAFHIVFGKTVPDISLNAVANLGYAQGRFLDPVYPGDTLSTTSTVIGLRQNKDGKSGVVYVRSVGSNQLGKPVLDYCRW